jgi:hypothetical protein
MKRLGLSLVLALFATGFMLGKPMERQIIGSEQDHSLEAEAGDCEHFYKTTFTNFSQHVQDQEQREITLTGVEPQVRVDATQEGGVSIHGWNRPFVRLIVCRFAAANSREQALRVMSAINVGFTDGRIEAFGPVSDATHVWWVNMILYVPRGVFVDVHAKNGGVAIRNMNGRVRASATSGGISVVQSTGKYVISTESGGITLDRISGRAEAFSRDGSIALKVPAGTSPNIEARTSTSQIVCALKNCDEGLGRWRADKRQLSIGGSPPDFRITTTGSQIVIGTVTN